VEIFNDILKLFSNATGMQVNERKSTLSINIISGEELDFLRHIFPLLVKELEKGLKYLGLNLKPNDYRKEDWFWLLRNLD
jgi:hypothetical protein